MEWLPFERPPNIQGEASPRNENPRHFRHRLGSIREILKSLLTQHHIEAGRVERQLDGAPLSPLNLRVVTGNVQHALVEVEPGYRAKLPADQVDTVGHQSGSTSGIKHSITIAAIGREDEIVRPRFHDLVSEAHER